MSDMLAEGGAWLEEQRRAHMTRTVTYQRGSDSVSVLATVGRSKFEEDAGFMVRVDVECRDYLITTADLILAARATLPEPGDQITEVGPGKPLVYEVCVPAKGEPAWRYSDADRLTLRIHTKIVTDGDAT